MEIWKPMASISRSRNSRARHLYSVRCSSNDIQWTQSGGMSKTSPEFLNKAFSFLNCIYVDQLWMHFTSFPTQFEKTNSNVASPPQSTYRSRGLKHNDVMSIVSFHKPNISNGCYLPGNSLPRLIGRLISKGHLNIMRWIIPSLFSSSNHRSKKRTCTNELLNAWLMNSRGDAEVEVSRHALKKGLHRMQGVTACGIKISTPRKLNI